MTVAFWHYLKEATTESPVRGGIRKWLCLTNYYLLPVALGVIFLILTIFFAAPMMFLRWLVISAFLLFLAISPPVGIILAIIAILAMFLGQCLGL